MAACLIGRHLVGPLCHSSAARPEAAWLVDSARTYLPSAARPAALEPLLAPRNELIDDHQHDDAERKNAQGRN
jgi:hypothetical protein